MNLFTQLENNEQRSRFGSKGSLHRTMPGSQVLPAGQHIIGAIPAGAVLESFHALAVGWDGDITVNIGTEDNPSEFFAGAVLVNNASQANSPLAPMDIYFPVGELIVCEITAGNVGTEGLLEFVVDYSELDTTAGQYTA